MSPTCWSVRGATLAEAQAAGRVLGADDAEALRPLGAAYGVAGVLRSVPVLARAGRCLLPLDVLGGHGLTAEAAMERARPFLKRPVAV